MNAASEAMVVALLRGVHVIALISSLGAIVFLTAVARPAMAETATEALLLTSRVLRLARISVLCALIIGIAWLVVEARVMVGVTDIASTLHAVSVVAFKTHIGQWLLLRFALLIAAIPLIALQPLRLASATVLAAVALALQPLFSHAGAIGGSAGTELIISEVLHLLAAAAWLGGLLPLLLAVSSLPLAAAAATCRAFTPVGMCAVLILAATAILQAAQFIGGLPGLLGTTYGHLALVKLGLFLVLLSLACLNRLVLTDRLDDNGSETSRRHMRRSIATEGILGALVVLTAGMLASQTPATHEQPVWPFAWRVSFAALTEPTLRLGVMAAFGACAGGIILAVIGFTPLLRRVRWLVVAIGGLALVVAVPHLNPLLFPAYPSSFFTSPTEFAASAIVHGAKLFADKCAACHGTEGHGDGPAASTLPLRPADLTAEHLWGHTDGDLYWFITNGFPAPDGGLAMPGFERALSSEARWHLVDYLHAHNAGANMRRSNAWTHPIPVPQFDAVCANRRSVNLDDLRGHLLRIVASDGDAQELPPVSTKMDVVDMALVRKRAVRSDDTTCVASEPAAWDAFAILVGVSPDDLAGMQILADRNGWLRVRQQAGRYDDEALATILRDIAEHPLPTSAGGVSAHHH